MSSVTAGFGLSRIGQIAMRVNDVERAIRFYRDALGMRFLFQVADRMAFIDCDGVRLMLSLPESPENDQPGSVLYFKVDDIESAHDAFVARGVKFEGRPHLVARLPDHDLWMAFFRDPDANLLALMSEVRGQ